MNNLFTIFPQNTVPLETPEYTVSEISTVLKRTIEKNFHTLKIRGEISGYNGPHASGHAYFSLKDNNSRLEAIIWKGTLRRLRLMPENGMEIVASGKLTTYAASSKYQIVIENLECAGAGTLHTLLEERKRRLQAEGIFNPEHKKKLPFMPRVIGVITSPTGAVIRDIIHRIRDRFPLHVLIWPVSVQGSMAHTEILHALEGFNALKNKESSIPRPDLLIIARGGGSIEDLWTFNDESLVRAVAASHIPLISAIGHETDWTLTDFAADVRAPTPTAAAEKATPVKKDLELMVVSLSKRLSVSLFRLLERKSVFLKFVTSKIPSIDTLLATPRQRLDDSTDRFRRSIKLKIEHKKIRFYALRFTPKILQYPIEKVRHRIKIAQERIDSASRTLLKNKKILLQHSIKLFSLDFLKRICVALSTRFRTTALLQENIFRARMTQRHENLSHIGRLLESLSYNAILGRGFTLIVNESGNFLKSASQIEHQDQVSILFSDGMVSAIVADKNPRKPSF